MLIIEFYPSETAFIANKTELSQIDGVSAPMHTASQLYDKSHLKRIEIDEFRMTLKVT